MFKNKIMNAKLSNKLNKIKQTRTAPKSFSFSKIFALSLLLSVLVVDGGAITIVGDNKKNAREFVLIVANNFDNNDSEGAQMMATASTLQLQKHQQNKTQNDNGKAAFEWQKRIGNSKFRHAQKRELNPNTDDERRINSSTNTRPDRVLKAVRRYNCFFTPVNCDIQQSLAQRRRSELNDMITVAATGTHRRSNNWRSAPSWSRGNALDRIRQILG